MFGEMMQELRLKAGLTQEQLASRSGISRGHIAALEVSRRRPSPQDIAALVAALRLEGQDRFAFEEEALLARIRGKRDIAPFVLAMRDRLLKAELELRSITSTLSDSIATNLALRDALLKNGLEIPRALSDALARFSDLADALKKKAGTDE